MSLVKRLKKWAKIREIAYYDTDGDVGKARLRYELYYGQHQVCGEASSRCSSVSGNSIRSESVASITSEMKILSSKGERAPTVAHAEVQPVEWTETVSRFIVPRAKTSVVTRKLTTEDRQAHDPKVFLNTLRNEFSKRAENVDDPASRAAMIKDAMEKSDVMTKVVAMIRQQEELDVLAEVPRIWSQMGSRMTIVRWGGEKFSLPVIDGDKVGFSTRCLELLCEVYLDRLGAAFEAQGQFLEKPETLWALHKICRPKFYEPLSSACRSAITLLLVVHCLEELVTEQDSELLRFVEKKKIHLDDYSSGAFVDTTAREELPIRSFITDQAFEMGFSVRLGFTWSQMVTLRDAIFHANEVVRIRSRVDLTARLESDVRQMVMTDPIDALKTCFAEAFMTRKQILLFMFSSGRSDNPKNECISCKRPGYTRDYKVLHTCCLTEWLVSEVQFPRTENGISLKDVVYLKPGISEYIRTLMAEKGRQRGALIGRDKAGFSVVKQDTEGGIRVISQIGVRQTALEAATFQSEVQELRKAIEKRSDSASAW